MISAGALAALAAAAGWAVATHLFRRAGETLPPLELNFWKGLIAGALLLLTLRLQGGGLFVLPPAETLWLALSGLIGIGLGDTAFFRALATLGTRRTLLVETLAPPVAALLALGFLGESLGWRSWAGIGLTVAGVAWVVGEQLPGSDTKLHWRAAGWGLLAALCQAGGAVIARSVLATGEIHASAAALLRLGAGLVVLVLLLALRGRPLALLVRTPGPRLLGYLVGGTLIGTWLGLWLQQAALARLPAGVAQTLLATSPVIAVLLAAAAGHRPSGRTWLGTALAVTGVALLF
jgi:drug/metabolite transporter (DMT)-like permease